MNLGAKVIVPKVLLDASFFFFFSPLRNIFWNMLCVSAFAQKLVVLMPELLLGGWGQIELCLYLCHPFPLRLGYVASLTFTAFPLSGFLPIFLLWDPEHLRDRAA